ncbi:hypothetical protein L1987_41541 [Smallanthus sonchifolius]|uniref:Uncharacterized protein n=1 Tax=Smallanthus sonchifolius TaxID=185202 RepID=A0ACB9GUL9_9ASTR|nr:hypothetical protein L1987_41541 [Smallanthus sonchifolius]
MHHLRFSSVATALISSLNATDSVADTHNTTNTRPTTAILSARFKVLVEYFRKGLDCFFAVWFIVGNVWIFGDHSSATDVPNLYRYNSNACHFPPYRFFHLNRCFVILQEFVNFYRLFSVFLTFSCVEYAMPFFLCATICCCLPPASENLTQNSGATTESINSLPTYKFKIKKHKRGKNKESHVGANEGGVVAAGTKNVRALSGEDALCRICLAKYANYDELLSQGLCGPVVKD